VNRSADLAAEHVVDEAVLVDAAAPRKCLRDDRRAEVVATAGVILDVGAGAWDCILDALSDLLGGGHVRLKDSRPDSPADLATLSIAMISFSDKGAEKVREFLAAQSADVSLAGLRVGVRGGGCSGFQYQLAFDEQRESDAVFESHGLKLLVDSDSMPYVQGAVIDYEESLQGAGFKVNNPNVVAACGCGSSFRVAEEQQVSAV
jgi:iron-sulfur cluster assembly protein